MAPNINSDLSGTETKSESKKNTLLTAGVVVLVIAAFLAGANSSNSSNLAKLGIKVLNQEPPANTATVDYDLLWKALEVVNREYVDKPLDQQKLMYGSIDGLLRALGDAHTSFFDPEENKKFKEDLEGNFEGIGAEISIKNDLLIVVAPLPNTPAERAGLLPQDTIIKIDGQETFNLSLEEAVNKIRGPKGSTVILTVLHKNEEKQVELNIVRDAIHVDSVTYEIKQASGQRLGVIKLSRFGPDTVSAFNAALNDIMSQPTQGLIVDLRNNPGGLLDAAVQVSSLWLTRDQVVLKELNAEKQESKYYSQGPGRLNGTKTVVLINEGSASASEILTGALQDYKLATVVGMKSFGRGGVPDLIAIGPGAAIKITIAKWLTPNGRSIDKQGLEPDIKVDRSLEDYQSGQDPQMERAIELISK